MKVSVTPFLSILLLIRLSLTVHREGNKNISSLNGPFHKSINKNNNSVLSWNFDPIYITPYRMVIIFTQNIFIWNVNSKKITWEWVILTLCAAILLVEMENTVLFSELRSRLTVVAKVVQLCYAEIPPLDLCWRHISESELAAGFMLRR